jgi:hypothetical protein
MVVNDVEFDVTIHVDLESDVLRHGAYQAHNVSQFWYKEKMSREDGKRRRCTRSTDGPVA